MSEKLPADTTRADRLSAYELLGIDEFLPNLDFDHYLTEREIESCNEALKQLESDVRPVAEILDEHPDPKTDFVYCVDFDVIRSAIAWMENPTGEDLWSSLALNFNHKSIMLLPGTLFEIMKYLGQRNIELEDARTGHGLFHALEKAVLEVDHNALNNPQRHAEIVDTFRRSEADPQQHYILNILKQKLVSEEPTFPPINERIFKTAVHYMSLRSRSDQIINNRVDAMNFATIEAMNRRAFHSGTKQKFILVSNTKRLLYLADRTAPFRELKFDENEQKIEVWNSKSTAIFQLLVNAAGGAEAADGEIWSLLTSIVQMRAWMKKIRRITYREFRDSHHLLQLVASLNNLQQRIDASRKDHEVVVGGKVYFDGDIQAFNEKILNLFDKKIQEANLQDVMDGTKRLRVEKYDRSEQFGYQEKLDLMSGPEDLVCSKISYDKYNLVTLDVGDLGEFPILKFVEVLNEITQSLLVRVTEGSFDLDADWYRELDEMPRKLTIIYTDNQSSSIDYNDYIELEKIVVLGKRTVDEISLLRIDTFLFSASYDGKFCALKYFPSYDIDREVRSFVSGIHNIISGSGHLDTDSAYFTELLS